MRVLHIVPYLPKASGVTTFVVECSDALQRLGVEQVVAVKDRVHEDVAPSTANVPRISDEDGLRRIAEFDILHLHGIWPPFLHRFVVAARRRKIPIVWSLHGMVSPWAMKYKWWKKCLPWLLWQKRDLQRAAVLHVTSEKEREWVMGQGNFGSILNVPLGTHIPARDKSRYDERPHVLLFVGRIDPIKALPKLIEAWSRLPRNDWRLRIVGGSGHSEYVESLKDLAVRLGVSSTVEFPGTKFGDDLLAEYESASALALVSETENFGAVVVDAMAHGLPVVTSRGTPWRAVVEHGCGWWVENSVDALSETLAAMMALTPQERAAMGERGRELVRAKYEWSAIARQMIAAYERVKKGG